MSGLGQGHNKKKIPIPCKKLKNQQVRFHYDVTVLAIESSKNLPSLENLSASGTAAALSSVVNTVSAVF